MTGLADGALVRVDGAGRATTVARTGPQPIAWLLRVAADGVVMLDLRFSHPRLRSIASVRCRGGVLYLGSMRGGSVGMLTPRRAPQR